MAQNQMQGLFTGAGVNDVYALQRQERDQKVRQAMADSAGAGGNFYANLQAQANEQMSQALQGGVRGLLQGTDLAPAEDPRLASARKREGDRNDINQMLAGFKSDDGKISEDELKQGYAELMSRGYPQEAASFLQQAQSMRKLDIDTAKANADMLAARNKGRLSGSKLKFEGDTVRTTDGGTWTLAKAEDGSLVPQKIGGEGGPTFNPKGAVITVKGKTPEEEVDHAFNIKSAEVWAEEKGDLRKAVDKQRTGLGLAKRALELLPQIKTGGITKISDSVTDFFGLTDANRGEFTNVTGEVLINKIGEFGSNPTEGERAFLEQVSAGMRQGWGVNEAILKRLVKIYGASLKRTSGYLGMNFTEVNKAKAAEASAMADDAQSLLDAWGAEEATEEASVVPLPELADRVIGQKYQSPNGLLTWTAEGWVQ